MLSNENIALIVQKNEADWVSCKSIISGLFQSYKNKFSIHKYELSASAGPYEFSRVVDNILRQNVKIVAYLDYSPCASGLLAEFARRDSKHIRFFIHLYGDFSLHANQWQLHTNSLKQINLKFIAASDAQRSFVSQFLVDENQVKKIPFPVDSFMFQFDQRLRNEARQRLKLGDEDFVYIYSGRISKQKNVIEMIKSMALARKHFELSFKLLVAGAIDDIFIPYAGLNSPLLKYSFDFHETIGNLDWVTYLGPLEQNDLVMALNASDHFISLSTHNDEDFGMAPLESLSTGLPCLLTSWGGYKSFATELNQYVSTIPTQRVGIENIPNWDYLQKYLFKTNGKVSDEQRVELARKTASHFSIDLVANQLKDLINNSNCELFKGFNSKFKDLADKMQFQPKSPFLKVNYNFDSFYEEIYAPYWS